MAKTILEKLKLDRYEKKAVLNESRVCSQELAQLAPYSTVLSGSFDLIFSYILTLDEMKETIENVWHKGALNEGGYLYLAYPKKGNKAYAESIHRDAIFPALQVDDATGLVPGTGLKFNRMVQLDEVFTVIGLKHEKDARRRTGPSQRVDDYKNRTVEIEVLLADHPKELAFYQSLTPSYKTDWARYVFSAVQNATREKRAREMIEILGKGYKTKELYRKARVE